jgi:uncharacterized membrane protein YgcG
MYQHYDAAPVQVPYRLATACRVMINSGQRHKRVMLAAGSAAAAAAAEAGSGGSSSRMPISAGCAVNTLASVCYSPCLKGVLWPIEMLLFRAHSDGVLRDLYLDEPGTKEGKSAAIGQQIQQSGLMELLPQLLTEAALLLQQAGVSACHPNISLGATGSSSSSSGGGGGSEAWASSTTTLPAFSYHIAEPAMQVLGVYEKLQLCWPTKAYAPVIVPECAEPVLALAWRAFQYASLFLADDAQPPHRLIAEGILNLLNAAEQAMFVALSKVVCIEAFVPEEYAAQSSLQQYKAAVLAAPSLLPCLTIMAASACYALLLPQLPQVVKAIEPPSAPAPAADSTAGSSTSKAKSRTGKSGCGTKGKSSSSGKASSSSSSSSSWPKGVPAWQVGYREQQKLPALQQKLLRLFGCSSTAVLCAAAVAAAGEATCEGKSMPDRIGLVMLKQSIACTLFTGTFAGMFASTSDDSSTLSAASPGGAITQQQKQQVYFLLPSLLLYWSAYRPVSVASYAQAKPVYPIATADSALADQAARAAMILAHQQGQWLLPLGWCQAAVLELPPLFSRIGQCLLQPAGTAPATGSSSSSQQVPTFCADPPLSSANSSQLHGLLVCSHQRQRDRTNLQQRVGWFGPSACRRSASAGGVCSAQQTLASARTASGAAHAAATRQRLDGSSYCSYSCYPAGWPRIGSWHKQEWLRQQHGTS